MSRRWSIALAGLLSTTIAFAENPDDRVAVAKAAAAVDPRTILENANNASGRLRAVSYEASFHGEGVLEDSIPRISGKVTVSRRPGRANHRIRIEGSSAQPGQAVAQPFIYASDGETAYRVDPASRRFTTGPVRDAASMEVGAVIPPKYFEPQPFTIEIERTQLIYQGTEAVDGVECHVVSAVPRNVVNRELRFFLGAKDYLLRRAENIVRRREPGSETESEGKIVFTAQGLSVQPKIDDGMFTLEKPEGFVEATFKSPMQQNPSGLLAAGVSAPDFELKAADGRTVSLKSLRGKVFVLDFWASWCGPCKMGMPGIEELHKRFKDKPVEVFGVICKQNTIPVQAALDYVKEKGYTYPQLLNGDAVADAYRVGGIPCIYVVDAEGKVAYATSGFQPSLHHVIGNVIEQSLRKRGP